LSLVNRFLHIGSCGYARACPQARSLVDAFCWQNSVLGGAGGGTVRSQTQCLAVFRESACVVRRKPGVAPMPAAKRVGGTHPTSPGLYASRFLRRAYDYTDAFIVPVARPGNAILRRQARQHMQATNRRVDSRVHAGSSQSADKFYAPAQAQSTHPALATSLRIVYFLPNLQFAISQDGRAHRRRLHTVFLQRVPSSI
jgi:hypothetical protein